MYLPQIPSISKCRSEWMWKGLGLGREAWSSALLLAGHFASCAIYCSKNNACRAIGLFSCAWFFLCKQPVYFLGDEFPRFSPVTVPMVDVF